MSRSRKARPRREALDARVEAEARAAVKDAGMSRVSAEAAVGSCDTLVGGLLPWLARHGLEARRIRAEGRLRPLPATHPWRGQEPRATHHAVLLEGRGVVVDPAARQFGPREPVVCTLQDFQRRWRRWT